MTSLLSDFYTFSKLKTKTDLTMGGLPGDPRGEVGTKWVSKGTRGGYVFVT